MHIGDLTSNYTYQNPTWLSSLTPERCQRRGNTSSVFQVENNAALIPPQPSLFSLPRDFPKPKQFSDALLAALGPAYQEHMWNVLFGCLDSIPTIPGCTYNISFRKILLESQPWYSAQVFCMEYSERWAWAGHAALLHTAYLTTPVTRWVWNICW